MVQQEWSTDICKEKHDKKVWRFDSRPSYMKYEFTCRTLDNVELLVQTAFYWRVIDVRSMITSCADAPEQHTRSLIAYAALAIRARTPAR